MSAGRTGYGRVHVLAGVDRNLMCGWVVRPGCAGTAGSSGSPSRAVRGPVSRAVGASYGPSTSRSYGPRRTPSSGPMSTVTVVSARLCSSRIDPVGASKRWASTDRGSGTSTTVQRAGADLGCRPQGVDEVLEPAQQRVRVAVLGADVHLLGAVPAAGDRPGAPARSVGAVEKPALRPVVPLHRGADRLPPGQRQVLTHPDLLAVADDRRAGQRELQGVRQLDPAPVAAQHRCQPATDAAAVQPHVRAAARTRANTSPRCSSVSRLRSSSSWLRRKVAHWPPVGQRTAVVQRLDQRLGVLPGQGQPHLRVEQEVEHHLGAVARAVRAGCRRTSTTSLGGDVGLAQQDRVAGLPLGLLPPVVQDGEVQRTRVHAGRRSARGRTAPRRSGSRTRRAGARTPSPCRSPPGPPDWTS